MKNLHPDFLRTNELNIQTPTAFSYYSRFGLSLPCILEALVGDLVGDSNDLREPNPGMECFYCLKMFVI